MYVTQCIPFLWVIIILESKVKMTKSTSSKRDRFKVPDYDSCNI